MVSVFNRRKRKADIEIEKRIISAAIVSTDFCKGIIPVMRPEYFQLEWGRMVWRWIIEYFDRYQEAPGRAIEDVYMVKAADLDEEVKDAIGLFLADLSDEYEVVEDWNIEYILDEQAVPYAKGRALLETSEMVKSLVNVGRIDEAESTIAGFTKISKASSQWVNPNDEAFVRSVFRQIDAGRLLELPGPLGALVGPMSRGWLVAVQGPAKRGKSWFMQELRTRALLSRLRVCEINLEMTQEQVAERYYKRIAACSSEGGEVLLPVFDCLYNQDGSCRKSQRKSRVALSEDGEPVEFTDAPADYVPCDVCRGTDDYSPAVWWECRETEPLDDAVALRKTKAMRLMYGDNYRLRCYPRFGANLDDIVRDLDVLEYSEGFYPDVLIVDYADIVAPVSKNLEGRQAIDSVWKGLAQIAGKRKMLVITATHANIRRVEGRKRQKGSDVSEDTRKLNHVDCLIVLDQTEYEKEAGMWRVGLGAHRHKPFNESARVTVLQRLDIGQPLLDSEFGEIEEV